jgi:hypothetical protein
MNHRVNSVRGLIRAVILPSIKRDIEKGAGLAVTFA